MLRNPSFNSTLELLKQHQRTLKFSNPLLNSQKIIPLSPKGEGFGGNVVSVSSPHLLEFYKQEGLLTIDGKPRLSCARSYFLDKRDMDLEGLVEYFITWVNYNEYLILQKQTFDGKNFDKKTLTRLLLKKNKLRHPIKLPILSRIVLDDKPYLYKITDGVHRITVAKELGLEFILAYVEESYYETIDNPTEGEAEI